MLCLAGNFWCEVFAWFAVGDRLTAALAQIPPGSEFFIDSPSEALLKLI